MRLDPDQLEWIVREVVRRLREGSSPLLSGEGPVREPHDQGPRDAHVILTQSVITAATLENKLNGVARLSVPPQAVVTPSARDLLSERGIELIRAT